MVLKLIRGHWDFNLLIHQRKIKDIRMQLASILQQGQFENFERVMRAQEIKNPFSNYDLMVKTQSKKMKVRSGTKRINTKAELCIVSLKKTGLLTVFRKVLVSRFHFQLAQSTFGTPKPNVIKRAN